MVDAAEQLAGEVRKAWVKDRAHKVKQSVTVYDLLRRNNIELKQHSDDREEQISCPFHGQDNKPSARVYPPSDQNPSGGLWCFVCQERWDLFKLWARFQGNPDMPFMQALRELEQTFHIDAPQAPEGARYEPQHQPKVDTELEQFLAKWDLANHRLGWAVDAYKTNPQGLERFLLHGQVLDKIRWSVEGKKVLPAAGLPVVEKVLEMIRTAEANQYVTNT